MSCILVVAVVAAIACADKAPPPPQRGGDKAPPPRERAIRPDTLWLLAAQPAGDAVHAVDTEASLAQRFGAGTVSLAWLQNGEGDSTYGIELFAHDSARRIAIRLTDSLGVRRLESAEIMGSASVWHVFPGITLGTSLTELERLNGRPFDLTGFDWEFPGGVTSWQGGHLDSVWVHAPHAPQPVAIFVTPDSVRDPTQAAKVIGDHPFSSADPPMRALNPRVYQIWIQLR